MQVVPRVSFFFVMFCLEMQQLQAGRESQGEPSQIAAILFQPAGAWFEGWCKNQDVLHIHFFNSVADRCQEMFLPGLKVWDELKLELLQLRKNALRTGTHETLPTDGFEENSSSLGEQEEMSSASSLDELLAS